MRRGVAPPHDLHTVALHDLVGHAALDIATLRHGKVENDAAGLHGGDLRIADRKAQFFLGRS